jgi:hypothetical protein
MLRVSGISAVLAGVLVLAEPQPGDTAGGRTVPDDALQDDRFYAVIVRVDRLPDPSYRSRVIRRKDVEPQNVILVTARTTQADLARAVSALAASYARHGRDITHTMTADIGPGRPLRGSEAADSKRATLARVMQALAASPKSGVPGFGDVPSVVLPARASEWAAPPR